MQEISVENMSNFTTKFILRFFFHIFIYLRKWVGVLLPEIVIFLGEKFEYFRYYYYEIAISYLPRHSVF